jgi:tetratricopeptide (TPR) repeat protein
MRWRLALLLALSPTPAFGDGESPDAPAKEAASGAPAAPAEVAGRVRAAWKAKDDEAIRGLAARRAPDPWLVVEEIVAGGEDRAAARAFAAAARGVDVEALPAYVEGRGEAVPPHVRAALAGAEAAAREKRFQPLLEVLAGLAEGPTKPKDVTSIRALHLRAVALQGLLRHAEGIEAATRAAEAAEGVGWLLGASRAWDVALTSSAARGDGRQSRSICERRLALEERRGSRFDQAQALLNMWITSRPWPPTTEGVGWLERALGLLERLLPEDVERAGATPRRVEETRAVALWRLAEARLARDDWAGALAGFRDSIARFEALGLTVRQAEVLATLGGARIDRSDYGEAILDLRRALALFVAAGNRNGEAWACGNLVTASMDLGRYDEADRYAAQALAAARSAGFRWQEAKSLQLAGNLQARRGLYRDASATLEQALEIFRSVRADAEVAGTLSDLGVARWRRGDWRIAGEHLRAARATYERLGQRRGIAQTMNNLGLLETSLGNLAVAADLHARSLALHREGTDRLGVSTALNNLARVRISLGDTAGGIDLLEDALRLARDVRSRSLEALILGNLANQHLALGDAQRAIDLRRQALEVLEAVGDRTPAAFSRRGLANALQSVGRSAEALPLAEAAAADFRAMGDGPNEAMSLGAVGLIRMTLGDLEAAFAAVDAARDVGAAAGDVVVTAWCDADRALVLARAGRHREAHDLFASLVAEGERLAHPLLALHAQRGVAVERLALGDARGALAAAHRAEEMRSVLYRGLAEEQSASVGETDVEASETGASAALALGDASALLYFLESRRAGALRDSLGAAEGMRAAAVAPALREEEARAVAAEREAGAALRAAVIEGKVDRIREARAALDTARRAAEDVVRRIQRDARAAADVLYPRADSLDAVRRRVREGEALVLYGLARKEATALVVTPKAVRAVPLGPTPAVRAACEAVASLRDPKASPAPVAALARLVFEPLALDATVRRVLVSPSGALFVVPFSLLAGDREVVLVPSATTYGMLSERGDAAGDGVLALGDPAYRGTSRGPGLARLPATRAEAEGVGDVTLLGEKATEKGLLEALATRPRWRAVHLACHGLIDPDRPAFSGLALTPEGEGDGLFTSVEVSRTRLSADLVVLSACETGRGKVYRGEGLLGLPRSFLFAGTPRVIVSLWKVDDEATAALMARFYARWRPRDGSTPLGTAAALKAAQDHVRAQAKWQHPSFWAAWVLWGLGD